MKAVTVVGLTLVFLQGFFNKMKIADIKVFYFFINHDHKIA